MTYRDALEFFATYGNVSSDPERLTRSRPTEGQLFEAVEHAVKRSDQLRETANAARRAIVEHWGKSHPVGQVDGCQSKE